MIESVSVQHLHSPVLHWQLEERWASIDNEERDGLTSHRSCRSCCRSRCCWRWSGWSRERSEKRGELGEGITYSDHDDYSEKGFCWEGGSMEGLYSCAGWLTYVWIRGRRSARALGAASAACLVFEACWAGLNGRKLAFTFLLLPDPSTSPLEPHGQ